MNTDLESQKQEAILELSYLVSGIVGVDDPLQEASDRLKAVSRRAVELRYLMIEVRNATTNRNPKLNDRSWAKAVDYCIEVQNAMTDYVEALEKFRKDIDGLANTFPALPGRIPGGR
jgi:hypothetical protein